MQAIGGDSKIGSPAMVPARFSRSARVPAERGLAVIHDGLVGRLVGLALVAGAEDGRGVDDGVVMEIAVLDAATGEVLLDTLVSLDGVPVEDGARAVHGISDAELVAARETERAGD